MSRILVSLVVVVMLGGCRYMNDDKGFLIDRSDDYLDAEQAPPLEIPAELSSETLVDTLNIPDLGDQPRTVFYAKEAPRPNPVFARENGQEVKIQKLGDDRWLVIAQKPSVVWPKVKQFLADNGIALAQEDPQGGRLETNWFDVIASESYRDIVRTSIQEARATESLESGKDRLLVRVEQGLRVGSTEIHIRHENDSLESLRIGGANWPNESMLKSLEQVLLNELGGYVVADVAQHSESKQAIELASQRKAEVVSDENGDPQLRFNMDFNRAWAVVGQALSNASIEVSDLDRSAGVFYVDVAAEDLIQDHKPGFFGRLFSFGSDDGSRSLQIRMSAEDDEQIVRIYEEQALAQLEISVQLLTLLRDFAG